MISIQNKLIKKIIIMGVLLILGYGAFFFSSNTCMTSVLVP